MGMSFTFKVLCRLCNNLNLLLLEVPCIHWCQLSQFLIRVVYKLCWQLGGGGVKDWSKLLMDSSNKKTADMGKVGVKNLEKLPSFMDGP